MFHRDGRRIGSFHKALATACSKAGLAVLVSERPRRIKPLRIPHDFRRTAVRNLERAGVPRSVAMQLIGHKTEAIYRRYAIVTERDLSEGVARLAQLHAAEATGTPPRVVALAARRLGIAKN